MAATSSWKFPFQKTKRERQQPSDRASLGFLEKKRDYLQRAARAHTKDKFVKDLQREAALRNPDEFYFSMITDTKNRPQETKSKARSEFTKEQILLLDTRDPAYIQSKLTSHRRKLATLLEALPRATPPPIRYFKTYEEAAAAAEMEQNEHREEEMQPEGLRAEIEARQKVVREFEEVLAEMQLTKDLKDGESQVVEDEEGNRSFIWKKERKR
jgi:hypothetical protein